MLSVGSEVLCVSGGHSRECVPDILGSPLKVSTSLCPRWPAEPRHLCVWELGARPVKRSMRMSPSGPWGPRRAAVPPAPRRRGRTLTSDLASHRAPMSLCQGRFLPKRPAPSEGKKVGVDEALYTGGGVQSGGGGESSGSEAQADLAPGQGRPGQRTPSRKSAKQDCNALFLAQFICLPRWRLCSRKAPGGSRGCGCPLLTSHPSPQPPMPGQLAPRLLALPQAPGPGLRQLCPPLCARESFAPICRQEVAAVASSHQGFLSIRKLSLNLAQQELERFDSTHGFRLCQAPGTWELRRAAALPADTLETSGPHVLPGCPEARGAPGFLGPPPIKTVKILCYNY